MRRLTLLALLLTPLPALAQPAAKTPNRANRLAYLDQLDPYYPGRHFPRLVTPQWVGEDGVEAVVVLAIDDMRDPKVYEAYLRPILRRLRQIDGRAPISIMTCAVDPADPQLQAWLREGLSLEVHTVDHPCPFFKPGFAAAKDTYDRCVDLMHQVPGSKPVAFRMPCCDSLNTPSPRFWAEVFNKATAKGNFLPLDSSVFNVFTAADPDLPRDLVLDEAGQERFRKYLPADRSFVNTIEDYPYPYLIGGRCWQFPCATPSDWQAQHLHRPCNPLTVRDWKAALDCTVHKKGVFCLVFHPYNWVKPAQVVELIDHAVSKHGKKVKFLTFREAHDRLRQNLLLGQPLRADPPARAADLLDLNGDGYLDVLVGTPRGPVCRVWSPREGRWETADVPAAVLPGRAHLGVLRPDGSASAVVRTMGPPMSRDRVRQDVWTFRAGRWVKTSGLSTTFPDVPPVLEGEFLLRDIDGDGRCELVFPGAGAVLVYDPARKDWVLRTPFPQELGWGDPAQSVRTARPDLRLHDLDGDGKLDLIFADEHQYGVFLFKDWKDGWSRKVMAGKAGDRGALPPLARGGTDNGFFIHSGSLWWSNEDTVLLKDHVARRPIRALLEGAAGAER